MKHTLMRGLLGSLLVLSCSTAFAGQGTLELMQGSANKLSSHNATGAISAESAYAADPLAKPDSQSTTADDTQSAASAGSPEAMAVWVTIQGTVRNDNNALVCAMALANGQYMFTCNPLGFYSLTVPLNNNGQIDLQVFAAGHMPFRMKLPANQGSYGVILEIAEDCPPVGEYCGNGYCGVGEDYINCPQDCAAPPPATSNLTVTMIDECPDALNIDYKHYDFTNSTVWPGTTQHWQTPGYGLKSTHTLQCENSGKVCFGARAGNLYWGVDVDGSKSCTGCCMPCENQSWTWRLTCN